MALMKFVESLWLVALFLMLANNKVHSQDITSFTFDRFSSNPSTLTYQGDARVLSGSSILSLAGTEPSGEPKKESVGRVLYSKPIKFWESSPARQATFETTIIFQIRPSRNGAAEGLAFFIAPVNTTIPAGSVGGNLGIYTGPTNRNIFAVEFDTNYNAWDPTYHHLGINVESRESKNVTRFNAGLGQIVTARINYIPNTKTVTVVVTSASQTAELSLVSDLKESLPREVQVGITSSTGWYISSVGIPNIRSWYFTSSLVSTLNHDQDTYIQQVVV